MRIKSPYFAILAIFIIAISAYSCRKDFLSEKSSDPKISWAEDYFKKTLQPNEGNQVIYHYATNFSNEGKRKTSPNMKKPLWTWAKAGKNDSVEFVEVPLLYTRKITPSISKKGAKPDLDIINATFDRLVIYKAKNGKINEQIVSYIPNKEYLLKNEGDISSNRFDKLDNDFDGYLIYKNWDGSIISINRVKNGTKKNIGVPVINPGSKHTSVDGKNTKVASATQTTSEEPNCEDYYYIEYEQTCYFDGDNPDPTYCDLPIVISETYLYTICTEEPEGPEEPGEDPDENCDNTQTSIEAQEASDNLSSTVLESAPTTRKKQYQWKYLKSLLWYYVSVEEGIHKKVGAEWQWDSLTHKREYRNGTVLGGTLSMTLNSHNATVGTYNAGMTINYDFKGEAVCKGTPLEYTRNNVTQNSPVWNVND